MFFLAPAASALLGTAVCFLLMLFPSCPAWCHLSLASHPSMASSCSLMIKFACFLMSVLQPAWLIPIKALLQLAENSSMLNIESFALSVTPPCSCQASAAPLDFFHFLLSTGADILCAFLHLAVWMLGPFCIIQMLPWHMWCIFLACWLIAFSSSVPRFCHQVLLGTELASVQLVIADCFSFCSWTEIH